MQESPSLKKAIGWILNSGIQQGNGAFCAWIDLGKSKNSFEYSEITGYGLSTLAFLKGVKAGKELDGRAEAASNWLREKAITGEGGVLARNYKPWEQADEKFSFSGGNVFAFDAGMVLNGLIEQKRVEEAKKVGNFLVEKMFDGRKIHAVYNVKKGKPADSDEKWSTQPGSYHAKLAIGLLKLASQAREQRFRDLAVALCKNALEMQEEDGRFVTNMADGSTHLHPHCYTAEGLLYAGLALGAQRFVDSAENAVAWALENQAGDGGINVYFDGSWNKSQRSDVLAQVLRLGLALKSIGRLANVEDGKLERLRQRLLLFQHETGGFLYGNELDLSEKNCVNAWCTMFALQALKWFDADKIDFGKVI